MQRVRYHTPRRLNPVSILFAAGVVLAGYAALKLWPVFWQRSQVDGALKAAVGATLGNTNAYAQNVDEYSLRRHALEELRSLGIARPALRVDRRGQLVRVQADYDVIVEHPFGIQPTKLHLAPAVEVELAPRR